MNADASDGEDFDRLAESFITRLRNGERPSLSGFAERHPAFAGKIFELFPALVEMEMHKPGRGGLTGPLVGHAPPATVVGRPSGWVITGSSARSARVAWVSCMRRSVSRSRPTSP